MEASAKQTSLTSHHILSAVCMPNNDADVMSAVSDFRSPVAATSNFRSPVHVTAAASDQKKAKRQASGKKKTDPKKLKEASE